MTMPTTNTIEAVFQGVQRLQNSTFGNPRYRVFTPTGAYLTESDAQVNHMIPDCIGKPVRITFNESGHIIGITQME